MYFYRCIFSYFRRINLKEISIYHHIFVRGFCLLIGFLCVSLSIYISNICETKTFCSFFRHIISTPVRVGSHISLRRTRTTLTVRWVSKQRTRNNWWKHHCLTLIPPHTHTHTYTFSLSFCVCVCVSLSLLLSLRWSACIVSFIRSHNIMLG